MRNILFRHVVTGKSAISLDLATGEDRRWYVDSARKDEGQITVKFGWLSSKLAGIHKFDQFVLGPFMLLYARRENG